MNLAINRPISATPVLDFRAILTLEADDTLEGYKLCLGEFIHVDLRSIETAYLEADAAGLHAGVLVQFNDRTNHIGVVTGRNLDVMNSLYTPARYPVDIHSSRGHYEYGATCARPIPLGTRAVALLKNEELVEGTVDQAGLSEDGKAFVVLAGQQLLLSDIAVLEALPSLH